MEDFFFFSKIVKKCNTGLTVYNLIGYSQRVSVLSFFPTVHLFFFFVFFLHVPFVSISKISYSYIDIHDDVHYEKHGIHKSRACN